MTKPEYLSANFITNSLELLLIRGFARRHTDLTLVLKRRNLNF